MINLPQIANNIKTFIIKYKFLLTISVLITFQLAIAVGLSANFDLKVTKIINESNTKTNTTENFQKNSETNSHNNLAENIYKNKILTSSSYTISNEDKNLLFRHLLKMMEAHEYSFREHTKLYLKATEQLLATKNETEKAGITKIKDQLSTEINSVQAAYYDTRDVTIGIFDSPNISLKKNLNQLPNQ